ncbi:MAG: hypothetical protein Q9168_000452 [Polycauliona sp. 1 TL-2023]
MEVPTNHSQLPRHLHNSYGSFNEDVHGSVERSIAEKSARPSPCWGAEEMAQSSYTPNVQNPCLYPSLSNIDSVNNQWNAPHYSFGYPTPQSESPLSPPQQVYSEFPLLAFQGTPEPSGPYLASGLPGVRGEFGGLSPFGRQFSHRLRLPSPGESPYPHGQGEDEQQADGADDEVDEEGGVGSEPYAQLIFRALKSAPGHKMVLKDIYQWFERHTNKARGGSKGWQNSIRHNLSMNGGFKKVDQDFPTDEAKRGFIWVLEPSALTDGVKSTTRYRKSGSNKRVAKAGHPAPERQRSGARGGKAARNAAKIRRCTRFEGSRKWNPEDIPLQSIETPSSNVANQPSTPSSLWTPDGIESFFGSDSPSLTPSSAGHSMYSYGDIAGVSGVIPDGSLFTDGCESMSTNDLMGFHPSFLPEDEIATSSSYKLEQIR